MGDDPERDPPFFFAKDNSNIVPISYSEQACISYPSATSQFEYEVEFVIPFVKGGQDLSIFQALEAILYYTVGLDITRRNQQWQVKKKRRLWEIGKFFSESAPIGPITLKSAQLEAELMKAEIDLKVNGVTD